VKKLILPLALLVTSVASPAAYGKDVLGVATSCETSSSHVKAIPGQEVQSGLGKKRYDQLSVAESNLFQTVASGIFGSTASQFQTVPVVVFRNHMPNGDPIPGGEQWRRLTGGPLALIRNDSGLCEWGVPISLGHVGNTAFAYSEVKCPHSVGRYQEFWHSFRLGMEAEDGKPTRICVHLGELANIRLGGSARESGQ